MRSLLEIQDDYVRAIDLAKLSFFSWRRWRLERLAFRNATIALLEMGWTANSVPYVLLDALETRSERGPF